MIYKSFTFIVLFLGLISCSTKLKLDEQAVGKRHITENPNNPYIYENGYKNYEIIRIQTIQNKDTSYVSELRFHAVLSAFYSKKLMFDRFGKWTNQIFLNNERHPVLIWENVKLFDSQNKLYSVAAYGIESWEEMYTSFMVLDSDNQDCLAKSGSEKDSIVQFFSNEIINLKSTSNFHKEYWKIVK